MHAAHRTFLDYSHHLAFIRLRKGALRMECPSPVVVFLPPVTPPFPSAFSYELLHLTNTKCVTTGRYYLTDDES